MLKDCYASFDADKGLLRIGNSAAEKAIRINGSFIATAWVKDKVNGTVWQGDTLRWQRCPVLLREETPAVKFEIFEVTEHAAIGPHLKAVLELAGQRGTVWYEYMVFPGIPFVFTQAFVESTSAVMVEEKPELSLNGSGNENVKIETEKKNAFCSADTLDCIPLGNRHLEAETFTLYDKTDIHDSLLERQTVPVYQRGMLEREGNIFRISDTANGNSLLLVKHAPTPSSALNHRGKDLVVLGNSFVSLMGTGIDFGDMPKEKIPYYASAVGAAKTADIMEAFWQYSTAFSKGDLRQSLFVMSNTWGDRSQDMAVCESFILEEIEAAHRVGVDIVQIDDGWQNGATVNSLRKSGGVWEGYYSNDNAFWSVNSERFPNGLHPVIEKAKSYGMELGLWFSPDSSDEFSNYKKDIDTLWNLYETYGIRHFKLDGIKIRSKICEKRFEHILSELTNRSGGTIRFNLDVTAEDRFGYLYYPQYGTIFVENRYTDWGNYYPHNTFKNLWSLAAVIPPRRLQMEFLNPRRNLDKYEGMAFAPSEYKMDYLFASVMPANPLVWMEVSHLSQDDAACLMQVTSLYKNYAGELFTSHVMPIGEAQNGSHFTGYCCKAPDGKSGHLLLFREQTADFAHTFTLPVDLEGKNIEVIYKSAPTVFCCDKNSIRVDIAEQRAFVWLKYSE